MGELFRALEQAALAEALQTVGRAESEQEFALLARMTAQQLLDAYFADHPLDFVAAFKDSGAFLERFLLSALGL